MADTWKLGGLFGTGAYAYADTQVPVWSAALGRFVPGTGGGGGGDVVGPAASVDGEVALYDGTTGKLLKRATGTGIVRVTSGVYGTPGNVVESEITLANNTTNDVSTTKHGFAPLLPNDATKYLDGTGAYTTPAGAGTVTTTGSPASGNLTKFSGATSITNADLTGDVTTSGGVATTLKTAAKTRAIGLVIDGAGSAITTGIKGDAYVPYACTITAVTMLADQSGSIVVDIWKDTYANYPPTGADSITASAKPTISSATKSQDTTLTGWTTSISAGDTLRFNVDSITTVTRLTLTLTVTV